MHDEYFYKYFAGTYCLNVPTWTAVDVIKYETCVVSKNTDPSLCITVKHLVLACQPLLVGCVPFCCLINQGWSLCVCILNIKVLLISCVVKCTDSVASPRLTMFA